MSDTIQPTEKQEPAFKVGDAVTVDGTAMTVVALGVPNRPDSGMGATYYGVRFKPRRGCRRAVVTVNLR